jgi:multisubunit Na+/H+ antiporter MnhC subunit
MNVGAVHAMALAFVNNTMVCLVLTSPSVCLGIASMASAAGISARVCVTLAPRRAKVRDTMEYAAPLHQAKILTTNVILGNALELGRVVSLKPRKPMGQRVLPRDNAHREIVSMEFVVILHARDCAALVRPRKKGKARMERVVPS